MTKTCNRKTLRIEKRKFCAVILDSHFFSPKFSEPIFAMIQKEKHGCILLAGGLLYTRDSGNLQYVTSASMVLLIYSKILTAAKIQGVQCGSAHFSPSQIKAFAKTQVKICTGV